MFCPIVLGLHPSLGKKSDQIWVKTFFFFALHLILGKKWDWFLILIFLVLKFSEVPGPSLFKILRTLLPQKLPVLSSRTAVFYKLLKFCRWPEKNFWRPFFRGGVLEDVLGLEYVLEDTFWSPWPWPRRSSPRPWSLRSSKIALSSARGQHYFLNRWNFVGKCQKPRGKFANTFFVFRNWSIGLAKLASPQLKFHQWQKCDKKAKCFFSFSFFLAFFAYTSSEQQYWRPGAPGPPQINFCQPI